MLNIQPKDSGGGGGETREAVVYRQADEMLDKLPGDYIPFEVGWNLHLNNLLACYNFGVLQLKIDNAQISLAFMQGFFLYSFRQLRNRIWRQGISMALTLGTSKVLLCH